MRTAQAGIFALGTSSHVYLELDLVDDKQRSEFAAAIAAIREPRTTTGGVNFVIGFRPELWQEMMPQRTPAAIEGFNKDIEGIEDFVIPATQHDALVWMSGSARARSREDASSDTDFSFLIPQRCTNGRRPTRGVGGRSLPA